MSGNTTILTQVEDPNYEPTQQEIEEYAKWLGMDVEEDADLFWIAKLGLKAPMPKHWKACRAADGDIYYFNFSTGESIWDHPMDEHFKKLSQEAKLAKLKKGLTGGPKRAKQPTPANVDMSKVALVEGLSDSEQLEGDEANEELPPLRQRILALAADIHAREKIVKHKQSLFEEATRQMNAAKQQMEAEQEKLDQETEELCSLKNEYKRQRKAARDAANTPCEQGSE